MILMLFYNKEDIFKIIKLIILEKNILIMVIIILVNLKMGNLMVEEFLYILKRRNGHMEITIMGNYKK